MAQVALAWVMSKEGTNSSLVRISADVKDSAKYRFVNLQVFRRLLSARHPWKIFTTCSVSQFQCQIDSIFDTDIYISYPQVPLI